MKTYQLSIVLGILSIPFLMDYFFIKEINHTISTKKEIHMTLNSMDNYRRNYLPTKIENTEQFDYTPQFSKLVNSLEQNSISVQKAYALKGKIHVIWDVRPSNASCILKDITLGPRLIINLDQKDCKTDVTSYKSIYL